MILDEDDYYETMRQNRIRRIRARKFRKAVESALYVLLLLSILAFVIMLLSKCSGREEVRTRAAYLEGRFNLDHATAMTFAESEVR